MDQIPEEDPLLTFEERVELPDHYSPTHLKTYTAGEDESRLQQAAKELGLQQARLPRPQVRKQVTQRNYYLSSPSDVWHLLTETTTEDARMLSVYSSHERLDEQGQELLQNSVPEWMTMETLIEGDEEKQGEEEVDVHAHGVGGDLVSAVLGIIKGMVGPAILYLPRGFATAGYAVALPIMMLSTAVFLYSSTCLLHSWKLENTKASMAVPSETTGLVQRRRNPRQLLSYPELAYRALGPTGESLVKTGIALMQSGVCLTYLIFVPQNLHTSLLILTGINISPSLLLLVMIGIQIPLSWIRDIRKLTLTNLLANCLILYGLTTCLGFAVNESTTSSDPDIGPMQELRHHFGQLKPFAQDWFLFIGTSVYLFEGTITLLVPLQEAVQTKKQRDQFPGVYQRTILSIICFYMFFGITCWMAFGHDVRTVLTTSLPSGVLATTVQLTYSVAVIFTFPFQNFPALEIATRTLSGVFEQQKGLHLLTKRNVLSGILVALLAIVAVATMDSLDKVVSLMGSLLGCPIAYVFPPLIHTRLAGSELSTARLWGNRIVAVFGVVAMVLASIATIMTWN